jgi:translation initiation factor IF-2
MTAVTPYLSPTTRPSSSRFHAASPLPGSRWLAGGSAVALQAGAGWPGGGGYGPPRPEPGGGVLWAGPRTEGGGGGSRREGGPPRPEPGGGPCAPTCTELGGLPAGAGLGGGGLTVSGPAGRGSGGGIPHLSCAFRTPGLGGGGGRGTLGGSMGRPVSGHTIAAMSCSRPQWKHRTVPKAVPSAIPRPGATENAAFDTARHARTTGYRL